MNINDRLHDNFNKKLINQIWDETKNKLNSKLFFELDLNLYAKIQNEVCTQFSERLDDKLMQMKYLLNHD